jgi:hypothetical protein
MGRSFSNFDRLTMEGSQRLTNLERQPPLKSLLPPQFCALRCLTLGIHILEVRSPPLVRMRLPLSSSSVIRPGSFAIPDASPLRDRWSCPRSGFVPFARLGIWIVAACTLARLRFLASPATSLYTILGFQFYSHELPHIPSNGTC